MAELYLEPDHHDPSSQCSLKKDMQDHFLRKKEVKKKKEKPNNKRESRTCLTEM